MSLEWKAHKLQISSTTTNNCKFLIHTVYSHNPRFELYGLDLFALKDNVIKSYLRGQIKRLSSMRLECRANKMTNKVEKHEAMAC